MTHRCNERIFKVKVKHSKDDEKNTLLSLNVVNYKVVHNIFISARFNLPNSTIDRECRKIVYQNDLDWKRLLMQPYENPIVSALVRTNVLKNLNFKLEFPLRPGTYKLINFSWPLVRMFRWKTLFKASVEFRVSLNESSRRTPLCSVNVTGKTF